MQLENSYGGKTAARHLEYSAYVDENNKTKGLWLVIAPSTAFACPVPRMTLPVIVSFSAVSCGLNCGVW